jgi:hypothetical protein
MPKAELEKFDGDSMRFHEFFASFDENVHNVTTNGRVRLARLMQYCTGEAKEAIRPCSLIGGEAGYQQARAILTNRFGNDHIVAQSVIRGMKSNKPVKSSTDLLKFANEMNTGQAILESLGKLQQIDTQISIIDIANRLPSYVKNRWKRVVMDAKEQTGDYPKFSSFVKFVSRQAEEAVDPVYGSWNVGKEATHFKFRS